MKDFKFVFPKNYDFKPKFLGMFDYSTAIVNVVWCVFIFCLINLIFTSLNLKIFVFIVLCLPLFLFSVIGFNHENILYVFYYIFKFMMSQKLFLFKKF